ncbi:unnamed protein product [Ectocarpus sp. 4 AP-2014]
MEGGGTSDEDDDDTLPPQTDKLALLDEEDSLDPDNPDDEIHGMEIPEGYRLQESIPTALDRSLLQHGVLVRLGMDGVVWWVDHTAISRLHSPLARLQCAAGARPEYAQDEAGLRQVQPRFGCGGGLVGSARECS